MSRIPCHCDTRLHIFYDYRTSANGNAITDGNILYNTNRRPYIHIIPYMGGMKCHTPVNVLFPAHTHFNRLV